MSAQDSEFQEDDRLGVIMNKCECQTEGAVMLKPQEANVVRSRGTENRLVFDEHRECAGI